MKIHNTDISIETTVRNGKDGDVKSVEADYLMGFNTICSFVAKHFCECKIFELNNVFVDWSKNDDSLTAIMNMEVVSDFLKNNAINSPDFQDNTSDTTHLCLKWCEKEQHVTISHRQPYVSIVGENDFTFSIKEMTVENDADFALKVFKGIRVFLKNWNFSLDQVLRRKVSAITGLSYQK